MEWQLSKDFNLFDVLPEEMIVKIVSYLELPDIAVVMRVSKHLRELLMDDLLWKNQFHKTWPNVFEDLTSSLKARKRLREEAEKEKEKKKQESEKEEKEKKMETEQTEQTTDSSQSVTEAEKGKENEESVTADNTTSEPPLKKQKTADNEPSSAEPNLNPAAAMGDHGGLLGIPLHLTMQIGSDSMFFTFPFQVVLLLLLLL